MAENKKSFLLYTDLIHTIEKMSDEETGKLFKHILRYVNDKNPEPETTLIDLVFEPIKQSLKRDLKRWEKGLEDKRIAGKIGNLKRWHIDIYNSYMNGEISIEEAINKSENRNTSQTDSPRSQTSQIVANVAVSVSDSVSDINNIYTNNLSVNWDALVEQFNEITGKSVRVVNEKTKRQFKARLKEGYTKEDFLTAIINCAKDPWHKEDGLKHLTLEFISRADKLEKFATMNPKLTG